MNLDNDVLRMYMVEANELLDKAESELLQIESNQNLEKTFEAVAEVFRFLKGSAGMIGLNEFQRHVFLIEDYLQKYKYDLNFFKTTLDYYLKGIESARKILTNEVSRLVFEIYDGKKTSGRSYFNSRRKKILFLSHHTIVPLQKEILSLEGVLEFSLEKKLVGDFSKGGILNNEFDIIMSDLRYDEIRKLIPPEKRQYPFILVVDDFQPEKNINKVFQILKKNDEKTRVQLAIQGALDASARIDLFEKSKSLLMYMYNDLVNFPAEGKDPELQKVLSIEVQNVLKNYER